MTRYRYGQQSGGSSVFALVVWILAAGVFWFWRWQYRRWGHAVGATMTSLIVFALLWAFLTSKYWADRLEQRSLRDPSESSYVAPKNL